MEKSKRRRSLFSVYAVASLDNFGFGIVFILFAPLLLDPVYGMLPYETSLATRNTLLGILFAAFPIAQFFGAPIFGDVGDRFGRKKAFFFTIIGITLGYALSALAISLKHVPFLIVSRVLTGFFAGNLSICLASIADVSPDEKERGKNFMVVTVVFAVSWTVAMLVGGYFTSPALAMWVTALLSLVSLWIVYAFFLETHTQEAKVKLDLLKGIHNIIMALRVRQMRPFFLVVFLWTIGWGLGLQWYTAVSLQKFGVTQQTASIGLLVQGLGWTIGGLFIGPTLLKRLSTHTTAMIAFTFSAVFLFFASLFKTYYPFTICYWISAITASLSMSTSLNLVSISAPKTMQGKAMGLSESVMAIGWFFVPIIGAPLGTIDLSHFYTGASVAVILGVLVLLTCKNRSSSV